MDAPRPDPSRPRGPWDYPGVYVEELSSGVPRVDAVDPSTTVFVGAASRGPVDEAVRVGSETEFERVFGGPASDAIGAFFRSGGPAAWFVRVPGGRPDEAVAVVLDRPPVAVHASDRTLGIEVGAAAARLTLHRCVSQGTSPRVRPAADARWSYVAIRRALMFVERSVDQALQWVVFEPDDEDLWSRLRRTVRGFLRRLLRRGEPGTVVGLASLEPGGFAVVEIVRCQDPR